MAAPGIELGTDPGEGALARLAFAFEHRALFAARLYDLVELGQPGFGLRAQRRGAPGAPLHFGDGGQARGIQRPQIDQLAPHFVRSASLQQHLERFLQAATMLRDQEASEGLTMAGLLLRESCQFCLLRAQLLLQQPLPRREFAERASGIGNRPFRLAQQVGGIGLFVAGLRQFTPQRFDFFAQFQKRSLVPAPLRAGLRRTRRLRLPGARRPHQDGERNDGKGADQDGMNSISGRPVISAGCGRPIIRSSVGATSWRAPPSCIRPRVQYRQTGPAAACAPYAAGR